MSYETEAGQAAVAATGFAIGDQVTLSNWYLTNYCNVSTWQNKPAEVVKITKHSVRIESISKEDRPMYAQKYGPKQEYEIIGLYIRFPGNASLYLVSPFGVNKV